jgi:hypothetical protein
VWLCTLHEISAELVKQNQGVNFALTHMSVGEVCDLEVQPEYGYGEKGSFSFPCVKPNATLLYRLELLDASPPADKRKGEMFFEERLEAAQRLRLQVSRHSAHAFVVNLAIQLSVLLLCFGFGRFMAPLVASR